MSHHVDIASRYLVAKALKNKKASEVAFVLGATYEKEVFSSLWMLKSFKTLKKYQQFGSKMNNTKSLMIDMKPNDTIKLDIFVLDKFEIYPEEEMLPEYGLYRYLYEPAKQQQDKETSYRLYLE